MTTSKLSRTVNRAAKAMFTASAIGSLSVVSALSFNPAQPAQATTGDGITAYVSPPLVQGPPSSYGTDIETFQSWTSCSSFPASAVGTFSGTCQRLTNGSNYVWGGASSTSDAPFVGGVPSEFVVTHGTQLTLTFAAPAKYVGFWWSAGSANNTVNLYTAASGATPAATFTTVTINSILGASIPSPYPGTATVSAIDGSTYNKGHYFGRPSNHTSLTPTSFSGQNNQSHAYLNIFASGSIAFTKIEFVGQNFEYDNVAVSSSAQTPIQNLVFIESVLGKTANFMPNGGSGTMGAQTESSAANLTANSFTRPGYTFTGWHTTSSGTGGTSYADQTSYNFSSDLTLHAQWTLSNLTVTHDTQGGSTITNGSITAVASIATSPGTPTRDGYTFNGWFTTATGGTALTFPHTHGRTTNFTLYAQWSLIPVSTTPPTSTTPPAISTTMNSVSLTLEAPRTAVVGQPIVVMARGFKPGERVVLRIGAGKTTTLIANEKGEVELSLTLGNASRGTKQVIASASESGRSVKSEIRVTARQELPVTGATPIPLAIWGLLITLLGCAFVASRRFFLR